MLAASSLRRHLAPLAQPWRRMRAARALQRRRVRGRDVAEAVRRRRHVRRQRGVIHQRRPAAREERAGALRGAALVRRKVGGGVALTIRHQLLGGETKHDQQRRVSTHARAERAGEPARAPAASRGASAPAARRSADTAPAVGRASEHVTRRRRAVQRWRPSAAPCRCRGAGRRGRTRAGTAGSTCRARATPPARTRQRAARAGRGGACVTRLCVRHHERAAVAALQVRRLDVIGVRLAARADARSGQGGVSARVPRRASHLRDARDGHRARNLRGLQRAPAPEPLRRCRRRAYERFLQRRCVGDGCMQTAAAARRTCLSMARRHASLHWWCALRACRQPARTARGCILADVTVA